ncbi:hypothetical protein O3M35_005529 [Rhynocoris fuscipes]|uniref:Peptidase S1 domain-containing protein n=1 Tax=Rhynocoris fuscipes TaxID=488301 RepID=A0AAW1DIK2_9HEMI
MTFKSRDMMEAPIVLLTIVLLVITNVNCLETLTPLKTVNEEIMLTKGQVNTVIIGNLTSNMNYRYKFRCAKDQNIDLKCAMRVEVTPAPKKRCDGYRFYVDSRVRTRWQCQTDPFFYYIAQSDKLDVVITSGPNKVVGDVECKIQAIDALKYTDYKKIPFDEVDSSEYGLKSKPGPKKTTCECGWANKSPARIIMGQDAGKHEYPFAVSLQYKSSNFHFCGGTLISTYFVISAAHCIGSTKPSSVVAVMGNHDERQRQISHKVKAITKHPHYSNQNHEYDAALLELETKVEYTDFVGPACLPTRDPKIDGQYVTAMGWGRMDKSEYATKNKYILKKTRLRVVDITSCSIDWVYHWDIPAARVICTWGNHTGVLPGDSGGTVVWRDPETNRYTLVGMPALIGSSRPDAHTAVHQLYDWIQEVIKKSSHPETNTCSKID